jgi:hypothetical protein
MAEIGDFALPGEQVAEPVRKTDELATGAEMHPSLNMTLREISFEILDLMEEYNSEETTDERRLSIEERMDKLDMAFETKADNLVNMIYAFNGHVDMLDAEIERLQKKKKQREKSIAWAKNYLSKQLYSQGKKTLQTSLHRITQTTSKTLEIKDESLIPKKFVLKEVVYKLDKKTIKDLIESGKEVKGAYIQEHLRIRIT